jgi:MoaA/NifB/PqqE/SkfB family radical SAM enzyme/Flp pilus assembly protein TadD
MDREQEITAACGWRDDGAYEKALEFFKSIAPDERYRERALLEIGKTYKMMNLPDQAIDHFAAVVRAYPRNGEAVAELGQTALLSGRYEAGVRALQAAARGDDWRVDLELSKLQFARNELALSMESLAKVERIRPGGSEVRIGRGRIYKKQNDYDRAEQEFAAVMAVDPGNADAAYEMGDLCQRMGEYGRAIGYFEQIAAGKRDKQIYLRLVELYHLNGDARKSDEAGRQALALTPDNPFDRDVILNEIEVLQRKTVLRSKVKRLWVTVTSRCNIRCKTCGLWHSAWDLPYKTAQEVMAYYPYLERLVWLGGEVFLYKHFEEMFDNAAKYPQLRQQVITNGYVLNEKWIDKIVRSGNTELTFSIDGTTKEVYESIRQGSNYEKVLENVRLIMAKKRDCGSKMDVRMNAVIMRSNYHQIEEFLELAKREGFNQVSLMALHFDLAPEENIFYGSRDSAPARAVAEAIPRLREKARQYGIDLDILLPPGADECGSAPAAVAETDEKSPQPQPAAPAAVRNICCKMPWRYLMMCDKGDVYLTGSCVKSIGNVYQNSLDEIWNSETARQYRENMIENKFEGFCRSECESRWE